MDISPTELLLGQMLDMARQEKTSIACLLASNDDLQSQLLETLTPEEEASLWYSWWFHARPDQLMPDGDWRTWFLCAGRGFGKTRSGAEAVRELAYENPGCRIALVGRSFDDVKKVMIEGESGLLAIHPPDDMPEWKSTLKTLKWKNGSQAFVYTSEEPRQLRGPQFHYAWADEIAAWKFVGTGDSDDTWMNLQMANRLGDHPRIIVTTTPRPMQFLKALSEKKDTVVTSGHTFANKANLPLVTLQALQDEYGDTRMGEQELGGKMLDAFEGALWSMSLLEQLVVARMPVAPLRSAVAVDPAEEYGRDNDETGIVVGSVGVDGLGYTTEDLSGRYPPETWGTLAIQAAARYNCPVVVETNKGGQNVEFVLRAAAEKMGFFPEIIAVKVKDGKITRAEPVAVLGEKRRILHVGHFYELFKQLTGYVPGTSKRSPDRLDAYVLLWMHLLLNKTKEITPGQKPRGW